MNKLQNYKNTSFDLSTSVNSESTKSADWSKEEESNANADGIDKPVDRRAKKSKSFTRLIRNKFKTKSNCKLKSKEPKSMVRSISIAFTSDNEYATSHKQVNKSISNLYLDNQDSRSTNLNEDSASTNDCKKSKLKKLSEKLRIKFKFRNNSLDDRSTDLDDSLEQQESDVFDKSDKDLACLSDDHSKTNMQLANKDCNQCDDQLDYSAEIGTDNCDDRLKNEMADNLLLNQIPPNTKSRPKSAVYLSNIGNHLDGSLKNNRFSTIEVNMLNLF